LSYKLGYKGIIHPINIEQVVPTIKLLLEGAIEHLEKDQADVVSKEETIGFLKMVLGCTEPETGYFYCPYPIEKQRAIEEWENEGGRYE